MWKFKRNLSLIGFLLLNAQLEDKENKYSFVETRDAADLAKRHRDQSRQASKQGQIACTMGD